jgi:hypothetical protein
MQQFLVFQARDVTSLFLPGRHDGGSQDALLINRQLYVAWECKRMGWTWCFFKVEPGDKVTVTHVTQNSQAIYEGTTRWIFLKKAASYSVH